MWMLILGIKSRINTFFKFQRVLGDCWVCLWDLALFPLLSSFILCRFDHIITVCDSPRNGAKGFVASFNDFDRICDLEKRLIRFRFNLKSTWIESSILIWSDFSLENHFSYILCTIKHQFSTLSYQSFMFWEYSWAGLRSSVLIDA